MEKQSQKTEEKEYQKLKKDDVVSLLGWFLIVEFFIRFNLSSSSTF
jgi:hypothetical protein